MRCRTRATFRASGGIQASIGGTGWLLTQPSISPSVPVAAGCRTEGCDGRPARQLAVVGRSSRRSQEPTSTSPCSTPRTASASRPAAACGGPMASGRESNRAESGGWAHRDLQIRGISNPRDAQLGDPPARLRQPGAKYPARPWVNSDIGRRAERRTFALEILAGCRFAGRSSMSRTIRLSVCRIQSWEAPISARSGVDREHAATDAVRRQVPVLSDTPTRSLELFGHAESRQRPSLQRPGQALRRHRGRRRPGSGSVARRVPRHARSERSRQDNHRRDLRRLASSPIPVWSRCSASPGAATGWPCVRGWAFSSRRRNSPTSCASARS